MIPSPSVGVAQNDFTPPRVHSPTPNPSADQLAELLVRAKAKDNRAWRELVQLYSSLVYSIPKRYGFPSAECDDVFQTVFVILLRELPAIRSPQTLPKWLMTTTHRECWRLAKARPAPAAPGQATPATQELPADTALRWEREHRVRSALHELGGRCERLIEALFLDPTRPDYEAIGRRLGIPPGSIGPTRARCLAKLAELLADLE